MGKFHEDVLAECLDERVRVLAFQRIDPAPAVENLQVVAAWKRRNWNMNRGIVFVSLPDNEGHLGELARRIKKPIGKAIGYRPILNVLGLQIILLGREVLSKAGELYRFVDRINTQTVVLQSIHLVETEARELLGDLSAPGPSFSEELGLPGWARVLEQVGQVTPPRLLLRAMGLQSHTLFERVKARLHYSPKTGRVSLSVRTWGQTGTVPILDAIEEGIGQFLTLE